MMVKVASSRGGFVNVEVKGLAEVQRMLLTKGKRIKAGMDAGVARGANLLQQEIQESIIGNRAEPKSVDTGQFGNAINLRKIKDAQYMIVPEGTYPNGTKVEEVASILEYGSGKIDERRHFRNSIERKRKEVIDLVSVEIRRAMR